MSILSAKEAYDQALSEMPRSDMNSLHGRAYSFIQKQARKHYRDEVKAFLNTLKVSDRTKTILRRELLHPVIVNGTAYSNFMEAAVQRLKQSGKSTSGRIAEWCVQRELEKKRLTKDKHFTTGKDGIDIIVYHPNMASERSRHRIEVKNVKMRERGIRGLAYKGDSLVGFFDSCREFGANKVREIEEHCRRTGGYAYVSPLIYNFLRKNKQLTGNTRFKLNTEIGKDMANFCKTGKL